jgi:tetratricopeptide (TPR) repeat protein
VGAVSVFASATACSDSGSANQHVARGDSLATQKKLPEAIAEYQLALRVDDRNTKARHHVGLALLQMGQLSRAYDALVKSVDGDPGNPNLRISIATIDLILARRDQARDQAYAGRERDSSSSLALVVRSAAASTPDQVRGTIKEVEARLPQVAKATWPRLALGTLYWRNKDTVAARRALEDGVAADTTSPEGHFLLSRFYSATGNASLADRELKRVSAVAPPGSVARLQAAKNLILLGQRDQARDIFGEMAEPSPENSVASRFAANLALSDARLDEATKAISRLAGSDTSDVEAMVLSGRLHLARHELDAAIADFQRALKVAPDVAPIHYYLAAAFLQSGKTTEAKAALTTAVTLAPNYPDAVFQLSELNIRDGAAGDARQLLDQFVESNPKSIRAHVLLGAALGAVGRTAEATEAFQQILRIDPNSSEGHYWLGMGFAAERKPEQARDEFEKALSISPEFREPMVQLVLMDLSAQVPELALRRLRNQLTVAPRSADLYDLLGLAHAAQGQVDSAAVAFSKSIELNPSLLDARVRLSELYAATGKPDQALSQAEAAVSIEPKNVRALMALGVAAQQKGDGVKARQAYQTALSVEPRFAGPANNLALLLSAGGDDATALTFALRAQELAPSDPHIMDTVGWILYKRGEYARAVKSLEESARLLPSSPSIQYHLGMAAQKAGNTSLAREALERALNSPTPFAEKEDARKVLLLLK